MAPVPCAVEGEIIGRALPGLFYSPDLVLRDENGFFRTLDRQPIAISRFLFGAPRPTSSYRPDHWLDDALLLQVAAVVSAVLMLAAGWVIISVF